MSEISEKVYSLLKKCFPHSVIVKEHYVKFKGTKLIFDFYIKDLKIFIEVQGRQHTQFVKHFHGDREGFVKSKHRDNLKIEYAQGENILLVQIHYDEELTEDSIMSKIYKSFKESVDEQHNNSSRKRPDKKR